MKKNLLLFVLYLFIFHLGYSQNIKKNDSLKELLITINPDSLQLKSQVYGNIIWNYATTRIKLDSARMYNDTLFAYSKEASFDKGIASSHYYYGFINRLEGNHKEGLEYLEKYIDYARIHKDSTKIINGLFQIAVIHSNMGNFSESLATHYKLLEIYKSRKNKNSEAYELQAIGHLLRKVGKHKEAIEAYEDAIQLFKETIIDKIGLSMAYESLGNTYSELKDYPKSENFYLEALAYAKSENNSDGIASVTENLGNLFYEKGDYKNALEYFSEALNARENMPSKRNIAISLSTVGKTYLSLEQDDKAEEYLLKSMTIAKENDMKPELVGIYENLIKLNKKQNKFKNAFNYQTAYMVINDSILGKEKMNQMLELNAKYETEKKDTQLQLLKVETEQKEQQNRLYFTLAIAGLVIACLLGFFGYKNKKNNTILAKQKKLLQVALDEKNTLLKEVHHRVKNSFQIVSSLLYLQSENMEDKEGKLAIKEAENRVRSMVLVHQKLYNNEELVGIDTKEYINDLVKDIFDSHQFQKETITYELDVESIVLDIETVTPIGLILNELIINTLKHAFKEVNSFSKLNINFAKANNQLVLTVRDNGKGFEGEIKSSSFGIMLMKALSKKLKATLKYNSTIGMGTVAVLNINKFSQLS
ncbi:tetratricopeptide repeat protein [Aureibaculum sp. A20]|uniref:histidine kinase n=1 Tax=Aureibaculum flavum TaxID=2795986 RepID=A0ABS0WV77_9FLAO|nr:tetratricopeptide repeat protein [Aureibaculum flavum]MBJ2175887.1 tetratricopeptide repeat protein [Aureibaculum flavum]